jgi:hypothetical protein
VTNYADRWVVISGPRDIAPESIPLLKSKMEAIVAERPAGIIFGGARGVDTGALRFARAVHPPYGNPLSGYPYAPKLVVIVPGTAAQQLPACTKAIRECADELIELHLPLDKPASYFKRNAAMLTTAQARTEPGQPPPVLVAFADAGSTYGGTRGCIEKARLMNIAVEEIPVVRIPAGA